MCAYGALIKDPLLCDYEILNVHPSLLPRWRGAAPDRARDHGRRRADRRLDHAPRRGARRRPGVPPGARADRPRRRLRHARRERLRALGGDLLVRALDERPPFAEQGEDGVTYAHKIEARDRALDFTRPPAAVERQVRALRPHIGARLPLPGGEFLGVIAARVDGDDARARRRPRPRRGRPAAARLQRRRAGADRDPPARRPADGRRRLAARPPRGRAGFFLDPRCPTATLDELVELGPRRVELGRRVGAVPVRARLPRRRRGARSAPRALATAEDPAARGVAAYVLGQLGVARARVRGRAAAALEAMAAARGGSRGARRRRARLRPPRRAVRAGHAAAPRRPRGRAASARASRWRSPAAPTRAPSPR